MADRAARTGTVPGTAADFSRTRLDREVAAVRRPGPTAARTSAPPPVDLDRFMARDYADVVAAVRLISGDRSRAEEAVQDALVALLSRPPAEPLRSAAAWVTVVASNAARSHYRRTGLEPCRLDRVGGATGPAPTGTTSNGTAPIGTASTEIQDDEIQDDEAADRLAQQVAVREAIGRLPLGQRQVCVMR